MFVLKAINMKTGETVAMIKISSLSKVNPAAEKICKINDCESKGILFQVFHDSDLNMIEEFYLPERKEVTNG